ncbi:MAG: DnaD domain protein [Clostridia bacterium]|nr:DnaD domain protein [Clostridia bacterium]
MAFCDREKQLIYDGNTVIDNKFILNYLPDAPEKCVAVYMLGLALSNSQGSDNSIETIAQKLDITPDDVMAAYQYWDELDLVTIVNDVPPRIVYKAIKDSASALRKINPSKYKKFSAQVQALFNGGRPINTNEYDAYYQFLEDTTFEQDALLAVIKYCIELKGNTIKYQYILAVARNEIAKGATTLATVTEHLNCQQKYDDDLKLVFKQMSANRKIDHSDREMYDKWVRELGFTQDVIVNVASTCKNGGMSKLDSLLCEYYKRGALSVKEIEAYTAQKTYLYELAKNINKSIGVYYQNVEMVIDEYVSVWLNKGFDDETLLAIAKYCFKSGIRTLNGLNDTIDKLYKNGITTLQSLHNYILAIAEKDESIKNILTVCGLDRRVTANDRLLFKTWTETWSMPYDIIVYVAEKAAGTNSPMSYINRILSDYKQAGITTVEQAQTYAYAVKQTTATKSAKVNGKDIEKHQYTDDEINALFTTLNDTED